MTDIVERLRAEASEAYESRFILVHSTMTEAADEIESLRQQLSESQAREQSMRSVLHTTLYRYPADNRIQIKNELATPEDSTALDEAIKQAKREVWLEAAEWADNCGERLADSAFSGLAAHYRIAAWQRR